MCHSAEGISGRGLLQMLFVQSGSLSSIATTQESETVSTIEKAERLKKELTDKWVTVAANAPELKRFANLTGKVKTVNMNCRALVEFDGSVDIGWYDIDTSFLTVVDGPQPKKAPAHAEKPAAKAPPAVAKPGTPAAGGSPLDKIRAAGSSPAAAPAAGGSPLDKIRAAGATPAGCRSCGRAGSSGRRSACRCDTKAGCSNDRFSAGSHSRHGGCEERLIAAEQGVQNKSTGRVIQRRQFLCHHHGTTRGLRNNGHRSGPDALRSYRIQNHFAKLRLFQKY